MKQFCILFATTLMASMTAYAQKNDSIPQSYTLQDLVIKGQKTFTRQTPDGLTITMKDNPAAKLGMAYDALKQMPLIDGSMGELRVAGKNGTPEIYVNNRLVRSQDELKRLPATNIKDIQIITHPDAKYGGEVTSVIRIRTKRLAEGFSGSVYAQAGRTEKTSSQASANLAYSTKNGASVFGGIDFNDYGFKQERQYHERFDNARLSTDTYGTHSNRLRTLTANAGMVYDFKENSAGVKYEFIRSLPDNYLVHNNEETNASAFKAISTNYDKRADAWNHHVNAYLVVKPWEKATLSVDGDYLTNGNSSYGKLRERSGDATVSSVNTTGVGGYRVAAGKADLETGLWKGTLDAGTRYSYTHNRAAFYKDATGETPDLKPGENKETQHLAAFYLSYKHSVGEYWNVKAGVRYEMTDFAYFLNGRKADAQSRTFRDMLPHAQIAYNRNGFSASLTYAATVNRPGYALLGSDYTYVSHTLWETGNPLLRSSRSHDITLDLGWKGWMLNLDFYRNERTFAPVYMYIPKQHINVTNYQNLPASNGLSILLYKEFAFGLWHPSFQGRLVLQDLKYGTPVQSYNKPIAQLMLNNRFDLPWDMHAYLNGIWITKGHSVLGEWGGSAALNFTLNKSFGERWSLNLEASDFVRSWRQKSTTRTNGVDYSFLIKGGSCGVSLSVMYRFNKAKHTYKGNSAAREELKRLK